MNKTRLLLSAIALTVASVAGAYDFKSGSLCYKITNATSKTVMVETYESSQADGNSDYIPVGTGTGAADARVNLISSGFASTTSVTRYSVTIPQTVTYGGSTYTVTAIGERAFYKKYLMQSLSIPNTVTSIGSNAFADCAALNDVKNDALTPQSINQTTFSGVTLSSATLTVNTVSKSAYQSADVWKNFGTIKVNHVYGDPVWTWSEDKTSATARFDCKDGDDTQLVNAVVASEVETVATCTEMGTTKYTATAVFGDTKYTDVQRLTNIEALGHDYQYKTNGDGTHAITCSRCDLNANAKHTYIDGICILCGASQSVERNIADVNGDGEVDIADVSAVLNVMYGGEANPFADVNQDGEVDIADVSSVLNVMYSK